MKKGVHRYGGSHREPRVIRTEAYLQSKGFTPVDGTMVREDVTHKSGETRKRRIIYKPLEGIDGYYKLERDYIEIKNSKP